MSHLLAPEAEADLNDIWYYVASRSGNIEIADRLIESITNRFLLLARYPHLGRNRDDELRRGLRSFGVGEYVIVYRVANDLVTILRVLRGSRDIERCFNHDTAALTRADGLVTVTDSPTNETLRSHAGLQRTVHAARSGSAGSRRAARR